MNNVDNQTDSVGFLRDQYLTLLESCLTGMIYEDKPIQRFGWRKFTPSQREHGTDWPSMAHTMIGTKRLHLLRNLVEDVINKNVSGDIVETGVWRGGACILVRGILKAYGVTDKSVWLADSFEGLPKPNVKDYPSDKGEKFHKYNELAISLDEVKNNFTKYDLLDDQVKFLKGWFKDTLPTAPIDKIAVLRLDGDLYESTIQALDALYMKVPLGGYIIIDDYHAVDACKKAVHDYLDKHNLTPTIEEIDGVGVYWQKTEKC